MAGATTPQLAAAVSEAGALGSLGLGSSTLEGARAAIEKTKTLTDRPFGVNFFCHRPAQRNAERESAWIKALTPLFQEFDTEPPAKLDEIYPSFVSSDEYLDLLLELKPAVASFHFGIPTASQIRALKDAGIFVMASVTSLAEARLIEEAGLDAVIAQGIEAGGHRGMFDPISPAAGATGSTSIDERLPTTVLTRLLASKTRVPVIAAGGVMDGQSIRAVMDLGASAAQLGTAFLLCPESAINEGYRNALKSSAAQHTSLTSVISGRPARGIVNRLISFAQAQAGVEPPAYPVTYDLAKRLNKAASQKGSTDFAAHWAGQGVDLIREMPAAKLITTLVSEMSA